MSKAGARDCTRVCVHECARIVLIVLSWFVAHVAAGYFHVLDLVVQLSSSKRFLKSIVVDFGDVIRPATIINNNPTGQSK